MSVELEPEVEVQVGEGGVGVGDGVGQLKPGRHVLAPSARVGLGERERIAFPFGSLAIERLRQHRRRGDGNAVPARANPDYVAEARSQLARDAETARSGPTSNPQLAILELDPHP